MTTTLRLVLALLGVVIGWSAIKHWIGGPELTGHYQEVGLGEAGRLIIASLQTVASVSLLISRTQKVTALLFSLIMLAVATRNALSGDSSRALQPMLLALWAASAAGALLVLQRRKRNSQSAD